jgi:hypothetical protein
MSAPPLLPGPRRIRQRAEAASPLKATARTRRMSDGGGLAWEETAYNDR